MAASEMIRAAREQVFPNSYAFISFFLWIYPSSF